MERMAVAKPVAWKPSPATKFHSFSALLAADHHDDHHAPSPPPAVTAAIRPKTLRLKPATSIVLNQDPTFIINNIFNNSFKVELPAPAPDLYSSSTSRNVIYKPLPRVVLPKNSPSKSDNIMEQPNMDYHHDLTDQHSTKSEPAGTSSLYETNKLNVKRAEASKIIEQNKSFPPWFDGYTWRKYGQKQVKGSEYPRSYYKCTHPNCPVRKMIERSVSGKIEEIVYKGEHNHPKPQPDKRRELEEKTSQIATNVELETKYCYQGLEDENNSNNEPKLIKRRKSELNQSSDSGLIHEESMRNDKVTIPNINSVESDTFRWRKYGQKAVKGNPYPRSYYRCTNLKCTARKYLERSSDDPNALITTYEGKHNHDMPTSSKAKF